MSKSKVGEDVYKKVEKVNAELFVLTYGSIVAQLCRDMSYEHVNEELEKMGYNIGIRLIEDFLARTEWQRCVDFRETAETVAKVGFKMFLNVTPVVTDWSEEDKTFTLTLDDNPLGEFVELPVEARSKLWYSNILCGVIRGTLEMVQMDVDAYFVHDILRGDEHTNLKVHLKQILKEEIPAGDD
ncbi:TRAPP I, II and III complex Rab GEF subunit Bet3 [Schizosaccharomyces osmophilus]|uniref:Trafficking protein particle complex subunit BET3 n=1 Tax=Schizosaccharomyces osmophilus TaxID=2545709 RepID=A0AAE9WD52_9SCHI|nr:TRAPP I, II and III complex Rab GEF subunit Bet3 [Schizosaccharomyces osmophilus]WBW73678.1 TRAPP I, II and III complex Rab GEF subunit Bet3 [Schizosaccharomyces osmophilus]